MSKSKFFFVGTTQQKFLYPDLKSTRRLKRPKRNTLKSLKLFLKKDYFHSSIGIIKFDLLNVFYTVVTCGNISSAAERLCLTQPATTLYLQKLEKEVGCVLFVKSKNFKKLKLTPFGLVFFTYVQRIFHIVVESLSLLNFRYSNKHFFSEKNPQLLQTGPIFNKNISLSNSVKTYSFCSNINFFTYGNFNKSFTKLLKFVPNSYQFYDNTTKVLILSKNSYLNSKLENQVLIKSIEINKLNNLSMVNETLFSFIVQNQFIEVQTISAFQTCIDFQVSETFYWGSEF